MVNYFKKKIIRRMFLYVLGAFICIQSILIISVIFDSKKKIEANYQKLIQSNHKLIQQEVRTLKTTDSITELIEKVKQTESTIISIDLKVYDTNSKSETKENTYTIADPKTNSIKVYDYIKRDNDLLLLHVGYNTNVVNKEIQEIVIQNILSFVISIILFALIIAFVSQNITKPVTKLVGFVKSYRFDPEIRVQIEGEDEIAQLGQEINDLANKIAIYENTIENEIIEAKKELNNAYNQLLVNEKLASIGKFAGGVAHEINSPLAGIKTSIQFIDLELGYLNKDNIEEFVASTKESIDIINKATDKAKEIITELLKHSSDKSESNLMKVMDLRTAINHSANLFETELTELNIYTRIDTTECNIYGNFEELTHAINNLIENSIHAMIIKEYIGKEKRTLHIELSKNEKDAILVIKDNGVGISEAIINKIFDPFFTTKDVGKGIGLGLTTTYNIMQKHNAEFQIESELGTFTKCIIKFKLVKQGFI